MLFQDPFLTLQSIDMILSFVLFYFGKEEEIT